MVTTLGYALLGLLTQGPATGYDLARRLQRPVGYFWSAGHSQIYPELARLEAAALVQHRVVDGPGPRPTKRYRTTPAGRRALRSWLLATTAEVDDREVLLRVFLLHVLSPGEAAGVVRAVREHHVRTLAAYRDQLADVAPADGEWSPVVTARMTLEWGVTFEEGRLAWCDGVLARLAALDG